MDPFSVDAYTPKEIARRIEEISLSKCTVDPLRVFALALLAGAFIALGAAFFTLITNDAGSMPAGVMRLIGGMAFCLGLILVVVAGAELFTGNNLLVMACIDGLITFQQLIQNWVIVYFGNFMGALGILLLMYLSGLWWQGDGSIAQNVVAIADSKVNLSWIEAFVRGVLCNILVCLAVWLSMAGRSVTDKILAVIFPISAFVALGFEHSVANMFFIPAGLLAQTDIGATLVVSEQLTLGGFFWHNLIPVTLGNMLGGSVFVGVFYWFIYLRN